MFAPVAPIQVLQALKEHGREFLGNYHLLLTHHILEHKEEFAALFSDGGYTLIVDNSIVELGAAAIDAAVFEACETVVGTHSKNWVVPVLADVMGNSPSTIQYASQSYTWWDERLKDNTQKAWNYPLMVVLQGNSWEAFCATADYFLATDMFPRIEWVGIPRILVQHLGTRTKAIEYVKALAPSVSIHLLGFSDDATDDAVCANIHGVMGIDSAVPLRTDGHFTPSAVIGPRPENWFDTAQLDNQMLKNLANARVWFS